jgi:hypothetical protein
MTPAVREPAMTAASVPPSVVLPPEPKRARRWPMLVAIGAAALLVGATVGYFAGAPARNDLRSQRDAALTQVTKLTDQLDTSKADLASTTKLLNTAKDGLSGAQADLATSQAALASMTDSRDTASATATACTTAATNAGDLITQWQDLLANFTEWLTTQPGSSAELTLQQHMNAQATAMDQQQAALNGQMTTCLG